MDWSKPFSHVEDPRCWQIGRTNSDAPTPDGHPSIIPMTEKLDLVCQHARRIVALPQPDACEQERQRTERSEVIQSGQVLAPRQVGVEKRPNKSAKLPNEPRWDSRAAMSAISVCRSEFDTRGWIRSKRRWSNFGATQGWPKTRNATKQRLR